MKGLYFLLGSAAAFGGGNRPLHLRCGQSARLKASPFGFEGSIKVSLGGQDQVREGWSALFRSGEVSKVIRPPNGIGSDGNIGGPPFDSLVSTLRSDLFSIQSTFESSLASLKSLDFSDLSLYKDAASSLVSSVGTFYDTVIAPLPPSQQAAVSVLLTFILFTSTLLAPPPLKTPYPEKVYDPVTAAQYFSARPIKQVARLLEISSLSASLLFKIFVLDKFRESTLERDEMRGEELADLLTTLGPTFIKVGQSLSIRSDLLNDAYANGLTKLQDRVPPFSSVQAFKIFEREFGKPVDTLFSDITPDPIASASLGQVFKATLRSTGEDVAIKVQRPNIEETVALDMHLVRSVARPLRALFNLQTDLVATTDTWGVGFVAELDYLKEAENAKLFTSQIQSTPLSGVVFAPTVIDDLSTSKVLTTEWIVGERLDQSSQSDVTALCGVAMNSYLTMMLELGVLHCDPHPGNLLRTTDGRLCILDWGLVTALDSDLQISLIEHVAHLTSKDYAEVPQDLVVLGFVPELMTEKMRESGVVEALSDIYGEWALGGGANRINVPEVVEKIKGLTKQGEGSIFRIPPYFVYIAKAFSVLEGIGLTNDPDYSVINACLPYISRRIVADKSDRMARALDSFVFGGSKDDDSRIVDVERAEQLITGFGEYQVTASGELTTTSAKLLEDQADALIELILTDDNDSPVTNLILEQLAKVIGATVRRQWMNLRLSSGVSGRGSEFGGQRTLLGLLVDPIGLYRQSAISNVDEVDEKVLEVSGRFAELIADIGGPILRNLSQEDQQRLLTKVSEKVWEKRSNLGAVGLRLGAYVVKQTADRLEKPLKVKGLEVMSPTNDRNGADLPEMIQTEPQSSAAQDFDNKDESIRLQQARSLLVSMND